MCGFAVKFYADEGTRELVGNNIVVFFIQESMKIPDLAHAVKPEPHNQMLQAASAHHTFSEFVSLMPESTHMLMWQMSDRTLPRSYATMQGFGVHSFRFVNDTGDSVFVKFRWRPKTGTLFAGLGQGGEKTFGADPKYHRRDLWKRIESGAYPEYELGVQIFTEEQAEQFSFDILDATKLISEEIIPVQPVGRMALNRNSENFFAEIEQVAFWITHVVPRIDFSNDPLPAGRIHSDIDFQIPRLGGPNFHEIPIKSLIVQAHNNQRDGLHRHAIHLGRVNYELNSLAGGCPFQAGAAQGFVPVPARLQANEEQAKVRRRSESSLITTPTPRCFTKLRRWWKKPILPPIPALSSARSPCRPFVSARCPCCAMHRKTWRKNWQKDWALKPRPMQCLWHWPTRPSQR